MERTPMLALAAGLIFVLALIEPGLAVLALLGLVAVLVMSRERMPDSGRDPIDLGRAFPVLARRRIDIASPWRARSTPPWVDESPVEPAGESTTEHEHCRWYGDEQHAV